MSFRSGKIKKLSFTNYKEYDFNNKDDFVINVVDIIKFCKDPKDDVFLVAEIEGAYLDSRFAYIDISAGKNKISIHITGKVFESLNSNERMFIEALNDKSSMFIIVLLVEKIRVKKMED